MRYLLVATLLTITVLAVLTSPSERWIPLSDDFQFFNPETDSLAIISLTQLIITNSDSLVAYGRLSAPSGWRYLKLCFPANPATAEQIAAAFPKFKEKDKKKFSYLSSGNRVKLEIIINYSVFLLRQKGKTGEIYLGLPAQIYKRT